MKGYRVVRAVRRFLRAGKVKGRFGRRDRDVQSLRRMGKSRHSFQQLVQRSVWESNVDFWIEMDTHPRRCDVCTHPVSTQVVHYASEYGIPALSNGDVLQRVQEVRFESQSCERKKKKNQKRIKRIKSQDTLTFLNRLPHSEKISGNFC